MYADNAQISHRQLFRQILTGLLGVCLLVIPAVPGLRGRQGILAVMAGTGIYMFLSICFIRVKTVFQDPERYLGKFTGRFFAFCYLSWLWLAGVWLLLVTAEVTERFLIEGSVSWAVILLAGAAAYLGSHQGLERRGRMGEVCFPLLITILGGMLFLALLKVRRGYLEETGSLTFWGWAEGTWDVLACLIPFLFLPFALGNVSRPGKAGRAMAGAAALLGGVLSLCILILQGSFGLGGYEHKEYPVFDLMAGVRIPGDFLERVDIFWIAAVMFNILFVLGSVFFYNHEILVRIKMEKTAGAAALAVTAAALVCRKLQVSEKWFFFLTERIYAPLFFLLLLYAAVRGKRKKGMILAGILCLLLPLLASCGVSLEKRVFPLSMSADYKDGHYRIIYGIPQLSQVTGQNKESSQGQEEAVEYQGKTPEDAQENFNRNQENYLDLGHIKALILGESLLENSGALQEFLGFLEEKPSVSGNIYVFSCKDNQELMSVERQEGDSVGNYLTGILENTQEGKPEDAVTLQDLYNAWHRGEEMPELLEVTVLNNRPEIRQYSW